MPDDQTPIPPEELRRQVEERVQEEAGTLGPATVEEDTPEARAPSRFVRACLEANELGDGMLYAALQRGRFLYNNTSGRWLRWAGHHWEIDVMEDHLATIEDVVDRYLQEADSVDSEIQEAVRSGDKESQKRLEHVRKSFYGRVKKLRGDRGRRSCILFARTCNQPLALRGDELDLHPWLLPCPNGTIDLQSGKFREGRPDELLSKASPIEWMGLDAPAKAWEAWLLEIFDGDEDLVRYIQRVFGYAIAGLTLEHIFIVLHGRGRNGKGTFVEILNHILGPLSGSIQSEMLLTSRQPRSSAGPSPDIIGLKGLRLAFASETDEGQRFSPAKVKLYTGGDQLVGRSPHDKYEVRFKPTHTLCLLTNHKPHAPGDDFAFWERVHLVPFNLSFVAREPVQDNERRARQGVAQELMEEAPGILAWLVRGCLEYQRIGLKPPEAVQEATRQYQRDEDLLADFLEAYCEIGEQLEVGASEIFDKFSDWFEETISKKGISQKKVGTILSRRFEKVKSMGRYVYKGLALKQTSI